MPDPIRRPFGLRVGRHLRLLTVLALLLQFWAVFHATGWLRWPVLA